jgi:hypothetical protein
MSELFKESEMQDNSPLAIKQNDSYITANSKRFAVRQNISENMLEMKQAYQIGARSMCEPVKAIVCNHCPYGEDVYNSNFCDDCSLIQVIEKLFKK